MRRVARFATAVLFAGTLMVMAAPTATADEPGGGNSGRCVICLIGF